MACLSTKTKFMCLLVAVNDASSFTYVQPLWPKSDALQVLKEQIHYAEIQTSRKLKSLCKWVSTAATSWQNKAGFCWQKTPAYTSKQIGKAEHTIRMIRGIMIAMMHPHCLFLMFWPFAAKATVFTKILLPNINNWIPYHIFFGKDLQGHLICSGPLNASHGLIYQKQSTRNSMNWPSLPYLLVMTKNTKNGNF